MTKFGTTAKGAPVDRITLAAGDLTVSILTLGAALQSVRLKGVAHDLTLGSDRIEDYEGPMLFHGMLCGPVVNRISNAKAIIHGMTYELERNQNGRIHLHSGKDAMQFHVWQVEDQTPSSVTLRIDMPDGLNGLPGNREVRARFEVLPPATLRLTITGTSDEATLMNIANHSYWNLDGTDRYDGHVLQLAADHYLPTTAEDYPTGEVESLDGHPMDLREAREVTAGIPAFDNNYCLAPARRDLTDVLWLRGKSGVGMVMATTEPGMQVYDGRRAIRPGRSAYEGLALEAQLWPDAPNNPGFPSILLEPGDTYRQITEWRFSPRP